ncbi:hypothetical protein EON65_08900 [archaeon]|nr:MAG: hypothetical protein EON65_08900 [archaeon]
MQEVISISSFDGQTIWLDFKTELFEVGNFLGGGAAGNVYECEHIASKGRFAIKVLNPLGFKITTSQLLRKFMVVSKGESFADHVKDAVICIKHVWWLMNTATKQYLACYYAERGAMLKELSLAQCMAIWGTDLPIDVNDNDVRANDHNRSLGLTTTPTYPPKYVDFLRKRDRIFREIRNMRKISAHPNVIRLEAVLELTQDSKCTLFLVMELANGGELFDRIKTDCGTCEDTARYFFWQLLQGVQHCHSQGVCHRDLKPENLLLQGEGKDAVLKVRNMISLVVMCSSKLMCSLYASRSLTLGFQRTSRTTCPGVWRCSKCPQPPPRPGLPPTSSRAIPVPRLATHKLVPRPRCPRSLLCACSSQWWAPPSMSPPRCCRPRATTAPRQTSGPWVSSCTPC